MAKEECDDNRQLRCQRKFEIMVNQFDELIEAVDAASRPPKSKRQRRRVNSSPKRSKRARGEANRERSTINYAIGTATTTTTVENSSSSSSSSQITTPDQIKDVLVKLVTRHLDDLNSHDHDHFPH